MKRAVGISTLVLLSACAQDASPECSGLVVDASQHPNSATFSWVTDAASTLSISYQVDGGRLISRMLSEDPTTTHDGAIHGLPALAEVSYTAVAAADSGDVFTCQGSFTTSNLPPELPELEVTVHEADQVSSERFLVGVAMGEDTTHPFIINRAGQIVWFGDSSDFDSVDQVEVARDGRGMLVGSYDFERDEDRGALHRVSLLGDVEETVPMVGGHHFFKQISDDTIAHPAIDVREWTMNGQQVDVVGDALIELEPATADTVEAFNSWDQLVPFEHDHFYSNFYPTGADWTHLNSIDYHASNDRYFISLPFLRSVLAIDAKTGAILEDYSERTYTFAGHPFMDAHDVRMIDDSTLSAINLYPDQAVVVEYDVDRNAKTLTPSWEYRGDIRTTFMGQFYRLENGNRVINYGSAGVIREVNPAGEVVWEVQTPIGFWFGNGQMIASIYEASQPY